MADRSSALPRHVSSGLDDRKKLEVLLRKNPIAYWQSAKDDAGRAFFELDGSRLGTGPAVTGSEPPANSIGVMAYGRAATHCFEEAPDPFWELGNRTAMSL